jgi:hypothetical protein
LHAENGAGYFKISLLTVVAPVTISKTAPRKILISTHACLAVETARLNPGSVRLRLPLLYRTRIGGIGMLAARRPQRRFL